MTGYKHIFIILALLGFASLTAHGADETLDVKAFKDQAPYWQSHRFFSLLMKAILGLSFKNRTNILLIKVSSTSPISAGR